MGQPHQPGRTVHRRTEVVAVTFLDGAEMHPHPHLDLAPRRARARPATPAGHPGPPRPRRRASGTPRRTRRRRWRTRTRRGPRSPPGGSRRDVRAPARIASGCCSHRGVEPSMSVNKKLTVPVGRPWWCPSSPMGTASHRQRSGVPWVGAAACTGRCAAVGSDRQPDRPPGRSSTCGRGGDGSGSCCGPTGCRVRPVGGVDGRPCGRVLEPGEPVRPRRLRGP